MRQILIPPKPDFPIIGYFENNKDLTICIECENFTWAMQYDSSPRCLVARVNFISNGALSLAKCSDINTDGNCKYYKVKKVVQKISLLVRLKNLFKCSKTTAIALCLSLC